MIKKDERRYWGCSYGQQDFAHIGQRAIGMLIKYQQDLPRLDQQPSTNGHTRRCSHPTMEHRRSCAAALFLIGDDEVVVAAFSSSSGGGGAATASLIDDAIFISGPVFWRLLAASEGEERRGEWAARYYGCLYRRRWPEREQIFVAGVVAGQNVPP